MGNWQLNEIVEIEKLEGPSCIKLALHLNAIFEGYRREGRDYEMIKKELILLLKHKETF